MLEVKPKRVNDPDKPGSKMDDYWTPSQVCTAAATGMSVNNKMTDSDRE